MRAVHGGASLDAEFIHIMDSCVMCRGCETACPSGVHFGELMEGARETMAREARYQPWWRRLGYRALSHHRLVLAAGTVGALAQRARLIPSKLAAGLPPLPLRRVALAPGRPDGARDVAGVRDDSSPADNAWLFTGCVMDAWQRPVHLAALRTMEATGATVRLSPSGSAGCCGALATHAGLVDIARRQARGVIAAMPGDASVVVDSAGCGAAMKEYGHLLGTPQAQAFAARVADVSEWLVGRDLPKGARLAMKVAVQDPCHLRHVQKAHLAVRELLADRVELVELADEGLCCGAGGAYSALHPEMAGAIRDRKLAAISSANADLVASANPGCSMYLAAAGARVMHPVELVDLSLSLARGQDR
jgi:glycolate oxidase iron-sulfur subunit